MRFLLVSVLGLVGATAVSAEVARFFRVEGQDGARGAYAGHVILRERARDAELEHVVEYERPLPDGQQLLRSWHGDATRGADGVLSLRVSLRKLGLITRFGDAQRTAADEAPVIVRGTARPATSMPASSPGAGAKSGGQAPGAFLVAFDGPAPSAPRETWTPVEERFAPAPRPDLRWRVFAPATVEHPVVSWLFVTFRARRDIAAYQGRPDFVTNEMRVAVDRTARTWYRRRGPGAVLLRNRVDDEFNRFEEDLRARAFSFKLVDKMLACEADMDRLHLDATGMIAGAIEDDPARRATSGDGALHQGVWVASQVYRYLVTGEPVALDHVRRGTGALLAMVEMVGDPTTFARAIQDATTAPSHWPRGTGAHAGLAWLPGGNNDMLHGIEYGFLAASKVLAPDDPLRPHMVSACRSLLEHCPVARRGTHVLFLSAVAADLSGDPADTARYEKALGWRTWIHRQWVAAGNGLMHLRGTTDWSGHHLAQVTFSALRLLRSGDPSLADAERTWREAGRFGVKNGWRRLFALREGLLTVLAGAQRQSGAVAEAKDILAEILAPKPLAPPGTAVAIDRRVDPGTCVSSVPTLPWKLDWLTNDGRIQVTTGVAYFQAGPWDNVFIRSPFQPGSAFSRVRHPSQDFLHAYWLARLTHVIEEAD